MDILALIESSQNTAAQSAIDNFISQFSGNEHIVKALYNVAYQWRRFKEYKKAIEMFQYIADTWPTAPDAMWAQMGVAKSNVERANFIAAQPALDKLIKNFSAHPDLPTALHYIARRYRKGKRYEEAKNIYRQITRKYPNTSHASTAQIEIAKMDILSCIDSENDTAAQTAIESLITDSSGHLGLSLALNHIAWKYEKLGKYEQAKSIYQQVVDQHADNFRGSKAQLDKSKCQIYLLINAGDNNNALAATNGLIAGFSGHPYLPDVVFQIGEQYYNKACWLRKEGATNQAKDDFQRASMVFEKVINELPASKIIPSACVHAGDCYHELKEYQKSNQYYQKILDDYPVFNMAWHALLLIGHNYEQMSRLGLISESVAEPMIRAVYEQFLEKYPSHPAAEHPRDWLDRHKS